LLLQIPIKDCRSLRLSEFLVKVPVMGRNDSNIKVCGRIEKGERVGFWIVRGSQNGRFIRWRSKGLRKAEQE
jgi:hypothetical protein